jgi:mono/diheme cytochrome c family protein
MNSKLASAFIVGAITVSAGTMAQAQQSSPAVQKFDTGKYEYGAHCAVCHGLSGKGDGIFGDQLKSGTVVANLTELSKKNNGVFPFKRVYETINNGKVSAHGTREMPIWGERYVRARILALTKYINRLQAK